VDKLPSIYAQDGEYVRPVPSAGVTVLEGQARKAEAAAQVTKDNTHFTDLIGAKIVQGPIAWADRALQERGVPRDENFYGDALNPFIEKWRAAGLENQTELLERATSAEHADLLMSFAMQNKQAQEDSAQYGLLGNAAASLFDPSMVAIGYASGGLAYGARATSLVNAVRSGVVAGATNVGTEAFVSQYDPEIDTSHLVSAGAFGFLTGGVFGFRSGELAEAAAGVNKVVREHTAPAEAAQTATDSMGAARVPGSVVDTLDGPAVGTPEWQQKILDDAYANAGIRSAFTGSGTGVSKRVDKFLPRFLKESTIRRDIAGRLGGSKSAVMRDLGRKLLKDSVGFTDRNVAVKFTAAEESTLLDQAVHGEYRKTVEQEWAKFSQKTGVRGDVARQSFNESVGYYIRGVAQDMEPEVVASAQRVASTFKRMADELRASGVPGFEKEFNGNGYLPRIFSAKGYTDLNATKGLAFDNIRDNLVKPAMRSAWVKNLAPGEALNEDLLHEVSEAWLKRGYEKAMGGPSDLHGTLAAADASSVRELLQEAGVDAQKIDALVGKLEKEAGERATHARAKSRIDLDESFGATLTDDLGNTHQVHIADLLENNVDNLVPDYIREMSGWAALKKHANIGTQAELDKYKQLALQHSKKAGDGDLSRALDITFNSILGRSTSDAPNSAWTRGSRLIRSQNFMTTMGQVGFTMLEGVGSVLGAVGVRNAFKAAPAAVNMVKKMRMGNFNNEEAAWLADVTGLGTDFVRNQPYLRLDAVGESVWRNDSAVGRSLNKLDRGMQYGQRYMSVVSGIAPMQQFLQGFAGVGTAARLVQLANKEGLSASMVRRLRAGGLDAKDQATIFARLKGLKSVHDIAGSWGSWTADEKRLLSLYVNRTAKRTIGEGGVGDSVQLMHSATGRIFTQFRTFMTNSYTSVLLHGLHMRDWQMAHMWMGSTLFAGIGMAARNYLNTTGDPEKRTKLMEWDNLTKQAIQQSSYSSILPFMIDTVAHDLGVKKAMGYDDEPVFAYGRSTGLDSGVQGIPTLATGRALWSLPKTAVAALDPNSRVTSKQAKDAMSLLWFQNVTGVRNGLSWAAKQLPEGDLPH
jgi:hypothetical protein